MPQATYPNPVRAARYDFTVKWIPIWSCSGWGFPCHDCCQSRGALLPHHFTLTHCPYLFQTSLKRGTVGGIFSVALSVGSHLPGVTWHPALWSPDFPPFVKTKSDCLTDSVINSIRVLSERPQIPMNLY